MDKRQASSPLSCYCFHLLLLRFYARLTRKLLASSTGESLQLINYPAPSYLLCSQPKPVTPQVLSKSYKICFHSNFIASILFLWATGLLCSNSNPAPENSTVLWFVCFYRHMSSGFLKIVRLFRCLLLKCRPPICHRVRFPFLLLGF